MQVSVRHRPAETHRARPPTSTPDPACRAARRRPPSRRGKLCLVLDLDHTLLNSATFAEVGPALHEALDVRAASEAAMLPPDQRLLFRLDAIKVGGPAARLPGSLDLPASPCAVHTGSALRVAPCPPLAARLTSPLAGRRWCLQMWTKLRPGVHSFLLGAARYYQLWIHTNGAHPAGTPAWAASRAR